MNHCYQLSRLPSISRLFIFFCIFFSKTHSARAITAWQYIEQYKGIAINEMYRTGVPASIKLAQALFESVNGNSPLATQGNNHFGVKCSYDWRGDLIFQDDDAPQECFRKYPDIGSSYKDHSDFLRNRKRYQHLFALKRTDYVSWAKGLQGAGYATNKQYAEKLIFYIEKYKLYILDIIPEQHRSFQPAKTNTQLIRTPTSVYSPAPISPTPAATIASGIKIVPPLTALPTAAVKSGVLISAAPPNTHCVQNGDTLFKIAQKYNLSVEHLRRVNRLSTDSIKINEVLRLL